MESSSPSDSGYGPGSSQPGNNGYAGLASAPSRGASALLERLEDPRTADALHRLLDRAELLAFAVEASDGFLRRGEVLAENMNIALHEAKAIATGPDAEPHPEGLAILSAVPKLLAASVQLAEIANSPGVKRLLESDVLERLGDPATIASLQTLIDQLPLVAFAAQAMEQFLQRGELLTSNLAEAMGEMRRIKTSIEPYRIGEAIAGLPKVIDAGIALINAGLFDPEVVGVLVEVGKQAAHPYNEAKHLPDNPITPWKLVQALRDPDVQRAVGVGLYIVKRYGQTFNRSEVSPPPKAGAASPTSAATSAAS